MNLLRWLGVGAAPDEVMNTSAMSAVGTEAPATLNVSPQEGQVLGQQHDWCLAHGGGHFVVGHLKGRSRD